MAARAGAKARLDTITPLEEQLKLDLGERFNENGLSQWPPPNVVSESVATFARLLR